MRKTFRFHLLPKLLIISLLLGTVVVTGCSSTVATTESAYTDSASTGLPVNPSIFEVTGEETNPVSIIFSNTDKTITYIPMIHIGTPQFYRAVAEKVTAEKENGSVLYYEFIDFDTLNEKDKRKVRSIVGILPTPKMYGEVSGDGYIGQPNDDFLGLVNNKDFNIDLTPEGLIHAYESEFGPIVVTGVDATSDLSEFATKVEPPENVNKIILQERNQIIVDAIINGPDKQIVLLYGEAHGPGIFAGLQAHDSAWKRIH